MAGDVRNAVLDEVADIAKTTSEYISNLEVVLQLTASDLDGDYRLLTDFSGVVLGRPDHIGKTKSNLI